MDVKLIFQAGGVINAQGAAPAPGGQTGGGQVLDPVLIVDPGGGQGVPDGVEAGCVIGDEQLSLRLNK